MMPSLTRRTFLHAATIATAASLGNRPDFADTIGSLTALEASAGGRIGVAGLNTANNAMVTHRAGERFPFCSTFKLLSVSAILKRSETDPGLLSRKIEYASQTLVKYSPITSLHLATGMTISALCAAALQESDNTAANLIIGLLGGPAAVTSFARSIGDDQFRLDRWEIALNDAVPGDPRDTTTPAAMVKDLQRAMLGDLLASPQRDQLIAWMRGCKTGFKRIRSAVPANWGVADKTGTGDYGTANDIAVIWPPGRPPIILVVYVTLEKRDAPARDDLVAAAARIALEGLG